MKFKKIISAVCVFAMAMSMVTVANAAALGGKPAVTATFAGYEIDEEYGNEVVAKINFRVDISAAEDLSAYSESGKGSNKVYAGNGINAFGTQWVIPEGFGYWDDTGAAPYTLNSNGDTITLAAKDNPNEYVIDEVVEFSVRYYMDNANYDATGNLVITDSTFDGKDSGEARIWSYYSNKGEVTVTGCEIPSYNEWKNGGDDDTSVLVDVAGLEGELAQYNGAKMFRAKATGLTADADDKLVITSVDTDESKTMERTIWDALDITGTDAVSISDITVVVMVTANADDYANGFTFSLE